MNQGSTEDSGRTEAGAREEWRNPLDSLNPSALVPELRVMIRPRGAIHVFNGCPTLRQLLPHDEQLAPEASRSQKAALQPRLLRLIRSAIDQIPRLTEVVPNVAIPALSEEVLNCLFAVDPQQGRSQRREQASKVVWPPRGRSADHFKDEVEDVYLTILAVSILNCVHESFDNRSNHNSIPGLEPTDFLSQSRTAASRIFVGLPDLAGVDLICSEIPESDRPYFAHPNDRNFLRYSKFADLDALIFVHTRLSQMFPQLTIRDYSAGEYSEIHAPDALIVLGGPPWNPKFADFQRNLPFHFEPHELGEDDPLVIDALGGVRYAPEWTASNQLLSDISVFARLRLQDDCLVVLLGGCLTLGVLGAASMFLDSRVAMGNAEYLEDKLEDPTANFVAVARTRRVGGFHQPPSFSSDDLLALLVEDEVGRFRLIAPGSEV